MAKNKHSGFTILEVLVTAVILSVGLLGVASLNILSIASRQNTSYRLQAMWFANDMAERMRMNLDAFYNLNVYTSGYTAAQTANCTTVTGCTQTQMALNDVWEWKQEIANNLPSGGGYVCYASNPTLSNGTSATVPVNWTGCAAPAGGIANQALITIWWLNRNNVYEQFSIVCKP